MPPVQHCPKTETEVYEASKRLRCGSDIYGNNQYMCLPNRNKTTLYEFCHEGVMGIQKPGRKYLSFYLCISLSFSFSLSLSLKYDFLRMRLIITNFLYEKRQTTENRMLTNQYVQKITITYTTQ